VESPACDFDSERHLRAKHAHAQRKMITFAGQGDRLNIGTQKVLLCLEATDGISCLLHHCGTYIYAGNAVVFSKDMMIAACAATKVNDRNGMIKFFAHRPHEREFTAVTDRTSIFVIGLAIRLGVPWSMKPKSFAAKESVQGFAALRRRVIALSNFLTASVCELYSARVATVKAPVLEARVHPIFLLVSSPRNKVRIKAVGLTSQQRLCPTSTEHGQILEGVVVHTRTV